MTYSEGVYVMSYTFQAGNCINLGGGYTCAQCGMYVYSGSFHFCYPQQPPKPTPCPSCGHCPTCGRTNGK